jgi:hypothetical protein
MLKPLVQKLLGKWAAVFYALVTIGLFVYPDLREAIPGLPEIGETARLLLGALGVTVTAAAEGIKTPGEAQ